MIIYKKMSEIDQLNIKKGKKKEDIVEKKICPAARKYSTMGDAYKAIQNNIQVYLVKEGKDGVPKISSYTRCAKTIQDNEQYCHIHAQMEKTNKEGLKIFEKDIVPSDKSDKIKWLANVNDTFFENMGKRGAKNKDCEKSFTFSDAANPVLLILKHKNPKLTTHLLIYASQLLKGNIELPQEVTKPIEQKKTDKLEKDDKYDLKDLMSMIPSNEDSSSDEKSEEGIECIDIYTTKQKLLWYNEENNKVYEPEGDDDGEEIGILKEISIDHHTIMHDDKYFTVVKEITDKKYGKIYCCSLTNKLFDKKLNQIGIKKKLKNNEYQLTFSNEL